MDDFDRMKKELFQAAYTADNNPDPEPISNPTFQAAYAADNCNLLAICVVYHFQAAYAAGNLACLKRGHNMLPSRLYGG